MSDTTPVGLRVEGKSEPLAVEREDSRFTWRYDGARPREQAAYRILVAGSSDALDPGGAVWDSGWVESGSQQAVYDGPALDPRTRYRWQVLARNETGESVRSDPAEFETAPAALEADWIAAELAGPDGEPAPAPYLRTEFEARGDVERARLYMAAGGVAEVTLNGERVGDAVLDPGQSDYDERVWYVAHDVTDLLEARNALGVAIGRERYAQTTEDTWGWHEPPWHEPEPCVLIEVDIEYGDGRSVTVTSGEEWRASDGATRFDSWFEGERYDARREPDGWTQPGFPDSEWKSARIVDGPSGELAPQPCQSIRVTDAFEPASVERLDDGRVVVDAGRMVAGWCELAVEAPAGTEVTLTYGERRAPDGSVDVRDLYHGEIERDFVDGQLQTDTYVAGDGGRETWEPRFSYRGFRYVQVAGAPDDISRGDVTVKAVHTAVDGRRTGDFACADDLLETIHGNARRAILNNLHSIPTDTPMYEKNGWTGDAFASGEAAIYDFEMLPFYRKWLADFADGQRESGEVPRIVPTSDWGYVESGQYGGTHDPCPVWDAAYVYLPWWCYRYGGDRRLLERHFDGGKRLLEFHRERADGHVIRTGHGDHLAPRHDRDEHAPEGPAICSTSHYYGMASTLSRIATELGRSEEARRYAGLASEIAATFNDAFLDRDRGIYTTGECEEYRQTSNVLPLAFDLVPPEYRSSVVSTLVSDIEGRDGHLDTGVVGTKYLLPVLTGAGHVDLAYEVATRTDYPSFGYWIEDGATALYEAWELDARSLDHHMFGSIQEWLYGYLAGIRPAEPGFGTVRVAPHLPSDLESASATVHTPGGTVESGWHRNGSYARFEMSLPANVDGVLHFPIDSSDATVNGRPPADVEGVDPGGERASYRVVPGTWTFEVPL